ncbi:uncharacterized protein LOC123516124 isoform X1 [Portunus trituberculatus]|uniref:uncharacterized protein LOC123516124 isoform X1 n=2 Tax=Portunus trituberculatus TaxID=210409 RepID=UPI001E1D0EA9|nr:uncharacterized protein LOC123516124 isoform X1 [Portunus trituberculatus]
MDTLLGVVCVMSLLTLAGGHPHLLDSINPIRVQTSALSLDQRYLPAIPTNPTAAYLAGQRAGIAAPSIPLLIKLHNGQAGSTQAAELQFGKGHHTAGYGYQPQVTHAPTASPFYTQGLHLPANVQAGSNLHSQPSIEEKYSMETVEIATKPPSLLSAVAKKHTLVVPQPASPAPSLPHRVLSATPAPIAQAPKPTSMQEVLTKVTEDPAPISAPADVDSKLQEPNEILTEVISGTDSSKATTSASGETKVSSNVLPYGFFRNDPFLMYRLPSAGAAQGEGHFVIMVPHHSASLATGQGKQNGVTVYLAKDVRVLKPQHHRELDLAY